MVETAEFEMTFEETVDHTDARATISLRGAKFVGFGRARRNPADPDLPVVGEELAAARALSELAHRLLDAAADAINEREGKPPHLAI
jgi:hypothetical protein